jgi:predicted phosphodiesterase
MGQKIALLSDAHGNSPALRAVLADIRTARCEQIYYLGDLINGLDPQGCVDLLHASGARIFIKGNAEQYLCTPDLDGLPGQDDPDNRGVIAFIRWVRARLDASSLAWIEAMPDWAEVDGMFLVHDSPLDRLFTDRWQIPGVAEAHQNWLFHSRGIPADLAESEWAELLAWMDARGCRSVWVGHTHEPFVRWFGPRLLCNVGSAGMPLDGDPRPSWVLWQDEQAEIRRVGYPFAEILALAESTPDFPMFQGPGRRRAYLKWLETGIHWRHHLNPEG